jgi:serine/threonine protein kinase
MSPEQARGHRVDKRADIWAFGCVLYEMVTGRRAFTGDNVTDTMASVIRINRFQSRAAAAPTADPTMPREGSEAAPRDIADAGTADEPAGQASRNAAPASRRTF